MDYLNFYENGEEVQRRLMNTVVKYDEDFYTVVDQNMGEDGIIRLWLRDEKENTIKKKINSPKFNKFRPFPLGMCNYQGEASFISRRAVRHGQQGLQLGMLHERGIEREGGQEDGALNTPYMGQSFLEMLRGHYPSFGETVEALRDPEVVNSSVAFHRNFALQRGPFRMLFLCNKNGPLGLVNGSSLTIERKNAYLREQIAELGVFTDITIED